MRLARRATLRQRWQGSSEECFSRFTLAAAAQRLTRPRSSSGSTTALLRKTAGDGVAWGRCLPAKWNRRARLHLLVDPGQLRMDLRLSSDLRSHRARSTHAGTHGQAQCPPAGKHRTRLLSERRYYEDAIKSIHPCARLAVRIR